MRGLIERYVREMVKIPSTSNTEMEKNCADYIAEELAKQPYFKEHPEQTGKYLLPEALRPVCALGSGKRKWRIP